MRNDARPTGEHAQQDLDPAHQEQVVQRSPAGASRPGASVVDERTSSSNTQHAGGLSGGDPEGPPRETPERLREEEQGFAPHRDNDPALPANDATLRTKI